jgi:hypothetical protein
MTTTELLYSNINCGPADLKFYWDNIYQKASPELQFHIDIARKFGKNRFIARQGEWTTPWPQSLIAEFQMPALVKNFCKSFSDITNERANVVRHIFENSDARVAILYSGGIDSTICLASLIQNLSPKELSKIDICMSSESVIENPIFYQKFIQGRFNILDSAFVSYAEIENAGNFAVTSDQGDSIFGTELGTEFYLRNTDLNPEDSFSKNEHRLLKFFELDEAPQFSTLFFQRILNNIKTSKVEIITLHDFFWWLIFNLKYMDCALRGPVFYCAGNKNRKQTIHKNIINWFNTADYQQWSLHNNNNGQKIRGNCANTYKWAGRKYIYQFDKSDWQFRHKLKISSLINISYRSSNRLIAKNIFGLDSSYNLISLQDPISKSLINNQLKIKD